MAEKVLMPQLGESVTEGTISKWFVTVGDTVEQYEPLCEVNTDKVNAEIPSTFTGTITEILVEEGETVAVGALICYIETTNATGIEATETQDKEEPPEPIVEQKSDTKVMKARYSPAVLSLAQEHSLVLSQLTGTGAGGRITRKDVLAIVAKQQQERETELVIEPSAPAEPYEPMVAAAVQSVSSEPTRNSVFEREPIVTAEGDQEIPLTAIRKTIAKRMLQSKHEVPHAWMMIEADVTDLVKLRSSLKDEFIQREGINLTFFPFFVKAVVEALKEHQMVNSVWTEDKIIIKKAVHMSIAVATEDALYVPVIRDADQKNVLGLAQAVNELVRKTRAGTLTIEDTTGGTFTCNNTGSFGSLLSAPIINQPQAAILSIEAIVKKPVVINDMIAIRDTVNLCLSLDHRILDGLVCGNFMQSIKQKLEAYGPETKIY